MDIQEFLQNKNKLWVLVPVVIAVVLFGLFYTMNKKTEEKPEQQNNVKFEVESQKEDSIANKTKAYELDAIERRKRTKLANGNDFYNDLRNREESEYEKNAIREMQAGLGSDYDSEEEIEDDASIYEYTAPDGSKWKSYSDYLKYLDDQLEEQERLERLIARYSKNGKDEAEIYRSLGMNVPERLLKSEQVDTIIPVDTIKEEDLSMFIINNEGKRQRRQRENSDTHANLIRACVHGNQTVYSGTTIRLRLLEPIIINGREIPKNTVFYAVAGAGGSRLRVTVENIRIGSYITPVSYIIYDNDAMEGLNIPNNLKAEAKRRVESQTIGQIRLPLSSIGTMTAEITSAINAVSSATRSVLQAQLSLIKVDLKANYQIYIKEETKGEKEAREALEKLNIQDFLKQLEPPKKTNSLKQLIDNLNDTDI